MRVRVLFGLWTLGAAAASVYLLLVALMGLKFMHGPSSVLRVVALLVALWVTYALGVWFAARRSLRHFE